ncbi:hypothetical protein [Jidongwangia harbinensis]|uniref:hypothetical protein n=1 Tax=Jidongwangia harbinensis TaxID=2878561 RepID=UPI001CDA1FC5|nr:hypothetical protein [Jidongwangia harbinensis]MCA2214332.1 hypothetical protein [Jidongwangia harbinensis]
MPDAPPRRGRKEAPLDPAAPPHRRELAQQLRDLKAECGGPTYRVLSELSHCASGTLSEAANGRRLPTWETTRAFVTGCLRHAGREAEASRLSAQWRVRWDRAAAAEAEHDATPPPVAVPARPAVPPARRGRTGRRLLVAAVALALVCALAGSVAPGPPPMTGLFNVVLAPYRWSGPGPLPAVAPRLQAAIRGELRTWSARTPSARTRGPERISRIDGEAGFAQVARAHGADVVLRPDFRAAGDGLTVTIEIFIAERTLGETPEFAGLHKLGLTEPADVIDGDLRLNEELAESTVHYLDAVVAFVRGLGAYGRGELSAAEEQFQLADRILATVERGPGGHRIRREVVHLMLGNTVGAADPARAAVHFRRAAEDAPGYRRAEMGLAETARTTAHCRPGDRNRARLEEAIGHYRRALTMDPTVDPARAVFLDMKARLGLGLAYQCLSLAGAAPRWALAETEFGAVARLYHGARLDSGSARQARWFAAEARAGQALNALAGGRPAAAATAYEEALGLLAGMDVVRPTFVERELVLLRNLRATYARLGRTADVARVDQRITAAERRR